MSEGAASNDISVTAVAMATVTLPLNSDVWPPKVAVAVSRVPPPIPPGSGKVNPNRFVVVRALRDAIDEARPVAARPRNGVGIRVVAADAAGSRPPLGERDDVGRSLSKARRVG